MADMREQLARTQRFIGLQAQGRELMSRAMPGVVNDEVTAALKALVDEAERMAASAGVDDQLTPRRMVEEFEADMLEWTARAHDSMRALAPALEYYERASRLYARLGNTAAVRRIEDKSAEVRLQSGQDIDAELMRLRKRLEEAAPGTLEEAQTLISLGELVSRAGDDYGALEWLLRAEEILGREPFRLPDASSMLQALARSLAAVQGQAAAGGSSAIADAMALRATHQRLFFALSNAYRAIDPKKSEEYGARVRRMDSDRSSTGSREALLEAVKKFVD